MSFRSILLNTIAILLYLIGIATILLLAMTFFMPENKIPTDHYLTTLGYFLGVILFTTIGAVFILCGWLIQKNLRKRKSRLTKMPEMESY